MSLETDYRKKLDHRALRQAYTKLGVDRPRPQPPQPEQQEPQPAQQGGPPDLLKMARDLMLQMSRGQQPGGN